MQTISKSKRLKNWNKIISSISLPKPQDKVSEWAEKNIVLGRDVSPLPGPFRYDPTPHWREVVDSKAKYIVILKGGQSGATQCVVVPKSLHTIAQNPCNIMITSGNEDLSAEFVSTRLDPAIASAGLQNKIRPSVQKKRNAKTGDTDKVKQFDGGNMFLCSVGAIDRVGKQKSLTVGIFDDWSASKMSDKKQGNLYSILQQRFNTSAFTKQQIFISTPEVDPDPTYELFLKGDQRKWHLPCPCCGSMIDLRWTDVINGERVGVIYEKDIEGQLIESSIRYKCQDCFDTFEEKEKYKMYRHGQWIATARPINPDWESYHINSLYGAPNMDGWDILAREWLSIYESGSCDEAKMKAWKNLRMGEPSFEEVKQSDASGIMTNLPGYNVGEVPNALSNSLGCGNILFLTAGVDFGGVEKDGRIDVEVVGWAENGQSFSIWQESLGTYSPNKIVREDHRRVKWTYENGYDHSLFPKLKELICDRVFKVDEGDEGLRVAFSCLDTGYLPDMIKAFLSNNPDVPAVSVVGRAEDSGFKFSAERPRYKDPNSESGLYTINVDYIKVDISRNMTKIISSESQELIPGTMCFPDPADKFYRKESFFKQLEGEELKPVKRASGEIFKYKWVARAGFQNHFLDARVYARAAMHIFIDVQVSRFVGKKKKYCKMSDLKEIYSNN